jgi:hypothetical protein
MVSSVLSADLAPGLAMHWRQRRLGDVCRQSITVEKGGMSRYWRNRDNRM